MPKVRNPEYPWSTERLIRLSKTWDFDSDVDRLDEDDGEPFWSRALNRTEEAMQTWRETHSPAADPLFDNSLEPFHVDDVAAPIYEVRRLHVLERKVINALGPPSTLMRFDKKLGKHVRDEGAPDDD